jgi:gamma-glutamyl phosphate reductase
VGDLLTDSVSDLARRAKAVAPVLAVADTEAKNAALKAAADRLIDDTDLILAANA